MMKDKGGGMIGNGTEICRVVKEKRDWGFTRFVRAYLSWFFQ